MTDREELEDSFEFEEQVEEVSSTDEGEARYDQSLVSPPPSPEPQADIRDNTITVEQARQLLFEKHGLGVNEDDPLFMALTINNLFIDRYDQMMREHRKLQITQTQEHISSLRCEVEKLTNKILREATNSNLVNTLAEIGAFSEVVGRLSQNLKNHRIMIGAMTLLNVVVLIMIYLTTL